MFERSLIMLEKLCLPSINELLDTEGTINSNTTHQRFMMIMKLYIIKICVGTTPTPLSETFLGLNLPYYL